MRDDLLLVLLERGDQVGLDLGPPVERQVGEDPDVVELAGAGVLDPDFHLDVLADLDLVVEVDGLDLDLAARRAG